MQNSLCIINEAINCVPELFICLFVLIFNNLSPHLMIYLLIKFSGTFHSSTWGHEEDGAEVSLRSGGDYQRISGRYWRDSEADSHHTDNKSTEVKQTWPGLSAAQIQATHALRICGGKSWRANFSMTPDF